MSHLESSNGPTNPKKPVRSKLAFALTLLTVPTVLAAGCNSGDTGSGGETEKLGTLQQGIGCKCLVGSVTCPPNNECGEWSCSSDGSVCTVAGRCVFKPSVAEGAGCKVAENQEGKCYAFKDPVERMECCGCLDADTGACHSGLTPAHCGTAGEKCQPPCEGETCAVAACAEGKCALDPKPREGQPCDDENACTGIGTCDGGKCKAPAVDCSDNDPCTTDPCNPNSGCTAHGDVPNNPPVSCNDGDVCTGPDNSDRCIDGECDGNPVVCNDFNDCTTDTCEDPTGCVFTSLPEGTTGCDDGSSCTDNDRCQDHDNDPSTPRICKGDGTSCDGGNPCINPDCEGDMCPAEPVPWREGEGCSILPCIVGSTCVEGVCTGGVDQCDDGNPCTVDACTANGCQFVAASGQCDDGNPCTENDTCDNKICEGTPIVCTPIDSCHSEGTCDPADGTCSDKRKPNGTVCDTTGECQNGVCIGGTVVVPGEGGSGGEGTGGNDSTGAGGNDSTGSGGNGSGSGGTNTTGSGGSTTDPNLQGGIFTRDPGGCSCRTPGSTESTPRTGTIALLLATVAGVFHRRRKAA